MGEYNKRRITAPNTAYQKGSARISLESLVNVWSFNFAG